MKLIGGLLSLVVLAFIAWAGVVWDTGNAIAKSQAEQMALVKLNEANFRYNTDRINQLKEGLRAIEKETKEANNRLILVSEKLDRISKRIKLD